MVILSVVMSFWCTYYNPYYQNKNVFFVADYKKPITTTKTENNPWIICSTVVLTIQEIGPTGPTVHGPDDLSIFSCSSKQLNGVRGSNLMEMYGEGVMEAL